MAQRYTTIEWKTRVFKLNSNIVYFNNICSVKQDTIRSSQVNIQLKNLMMITRKCTNHPYLIDYPLTPTGQYKVDEDLVDCSGKLKLLDKMLLAMKERGHKVNSNYRIFSKYGPGVNYFNYLASDQTLN